MNVGSLTCTTRTSTNALLGPMTETLSSPSLDALLTSRITVVLAFVTSLEPIHSWPLSVTFALLTF